MDFDFNRNLFYFIHPSFRSRLRIRLLKYSKLVLFYYRTFYCFNDTPRNLLSRQTNYRKEKTIDISFDRKLDIYDYKFYFQRSIITCSNFDGSYKFFLDSKCRSNVPNDSLISVIGLKSSWSSYRKFYRKRDRSFYLYLRSFSVVLGRFYSYDGDIGWSLAFNYIDSFSFTIRYHRYEVRYSTGS